MELWIRSQNKKVLAKIHSINIEEKTSTKFSIAGNDEWRLGIYETKERALEILDEIQDTLIAKYVTSLNPRAAMLETEEETTKALKKMAIYDMPKE